MYGSSITITSPFLVCCCHPPRLLEHVLIPIYRWHLDYFPLWFVWELSEKVQITFKAELGPPVLGTIEGSQQVVQDNSRRSKDLSPQLNNWSAPSSFILLLHRPRGFASALASIGLHRPSIIDHQSQSISPASLNSRTDTLPHYLSLQYCLYNSCPRPPRHRHCLSHCHHHMNWLPRTTLGLIILTHQVFSVLR